MYTIGSQNTVAVIYALPVTVLGIAHNSHAGSIKLECIHGILAPRVSVHCQIDSACIFAYGSTTYVADRLPPAISKGVEPRNR